MWFAAQAAGVTVPESARSAWALFGVVAILLLLFLIVVACIGMLRIRRRRVDRAKQSDAGTSVDPWREAGRRMRP